MERDDAHADLVDVARLRQRFDDDEELLAEIFQVFVAETPGRRTDFEAALAEGDMGRLAQQAHSLKGVAGTMLAEPLRLSAYALELAAKAGDAGTVAPLSKRMLDLLDATCRFVREL